MDDETKTMLLAVRQALDTGNNNGAAEICFNLANYRGLVGDGDNLQQTLTLLLLYLISELVSEIEETKS